MNSSSLESAFLMVRFRTIGSKFYTTKLTPNSFAISEILVRNSRLSALEDMLL